MRGRGWAGVPFRMVWNPFVAEEVASGTRNARDVSRGGKDSQGGRGGGTNEPEEELPTDNCTAWGGGIAMIT